MRRFLFYLVRTPLFFLFFLPFDWLFVPHLILFTPFFILMTLWIFAWTLEKLVGRRFPPAAGNPLNLPFLLVLVLFAASMIGRPLTLWGMVTLVQWTEYAVVVVIVGDLSGEPACLRIIIAGILFSGIVSAIGGIVDFSHYLAIHHGWFYRARFLFESPNLLADFLLLMIPSLLLRFASPKKDFSRRFAGLAAFLLLVTFALTLSRGAWIGFLAGFLFIAWVEKRNAKRLFPPLGGFFAAVAFAAAFLPREALRRVMLIPFHLDTSSAIRLDVWKSSLLMLRDHPLLGVGLGNFSAAYMRYAFPGPGLHYRLMPHAQELYLQIAAECGLTGLLAFAVLVAVLIRIGWQSWSRLERRFEKDLALGILAAGIAFLVHGLFDYTLWYAKVGVLFWTLAGVETALWRFALHPAGGEKKGESASAISAS